MPHRLRRGPARSRSPVDSDAPELTLYIGGVHGTRAPMLIRTVLGSCVSVCLWDPETQIGGMNHFMLPDSDGSGVLAEPNRFGVNAMDCLIGSVMRIGAERHRLVAKCFGGGHVISIGTEASSVARRNVDFIREFLRDEGIPIQASDLGGTHARQVQFYTATGRAFVKKISAVQTQERLAAAERSIARRVPSTGSVILFDD